MADQGLWFKLWCSSLDDPDLDNLDLCDFARWAKLGALVKRQGTGGALTIRPPARALCALFQVPDFDVLLACMTRMPHVRVRRDGDTVSSETYAVVSFHNWSKYQGDYSTFRVQRHRSKKRIRGEEKRREEKRPEETVPPITSPPQFSEAWPDKLADVHDRLVEIHAPESLFDADFWTRIDEWLGPEDSGVGYLAELDKYLAWIAGLPPKQRHRDHRRGFRNWLATAESRATEERRRRAQGPTHSRRR